MSIKFYKLSEKSNKDYSASFIFVLSNFPNYYIYEKQC